MANPQPREIIAAHGTIYTADVGSTFPAVDATPPSATWTKVGTSGGLNYGGDGITIEFPQSSTEVMVHGSPVAVKLLRSSEGASIKAVLLDLDPDMEQIAFDRNTVDKSTTGVEKLGMGRGFDVDMVALLVRLDASPLMESGKSQYQFPNCGQVGSPTIVWRGNEPAGISLEWKAIADPSATDDENRFCTHVVESA